MNEKQSEKYETLTKLKMCSDEILNNEIQNKTIFWLFLFLFFIEIFLFFFSFCYLTQFRAFQVISILSLIRLYFMLFFPNKICLLK